MIKKSTLAFILTGLLITTTLAQEKKDITLKDAVIGRWTNLRPDYLSQLQWIPTTDNYSYIKRDKEQVLVSQSINGSNAKNIVSLTEINRLSGLKLKHFPNITWVTGKRFVFFNKQVFFSFDTQSKHLQKVAHLKENATNVDAHYPTNKVAFTVLNNLYLQDGHKFKMITNEQNDKVTNGQAVHRYEFGIEKGTFWSKSGEKLAFYEKRELDVTEYPLIDYKETPAKLTPIVYPMSGQFSQYVRVGIFNTITDKVTYLQPRKEEDSYWTNISWGPKEEFIYISNLNRAQNFVQLSKYDIETGKLVQTLIEEKSDKYVEPVHPIQFVADGFIWFSERDGLMQMYHYDFNGKLINHIDTENTMMDHYHGYDQKTDQIFFTGIDISGIDQHLYSVKLHPSGKQFKLKKISRAKGIHKPKLNDAFSYAIDQFSNKNTPNQIDVINLKKGKVSTVLKSKNTLAPYKQAQTTIEKIKAKDGTALFCRIIKPHDFDESKKYPVLLYVYNGPNVQLINSSWLNGASLWMHTMANRGYIILSVDGRGSSNRGLAFEQSTHHKLGQVEMQDQITGIEHLKKQPYVDANRIAVHGWSYGGFMTISLMENYPDVFTTGVAGGPVTDWSLYEVMYTERYMGNPELNYEGYELTSTLNKVDQIKGKLMLIHGLDDDVVLPQHSINFIKHAVDKGVQLDFFVYPGHKHNVRGKDRVHLMKKVLDYIELHNR